MSAWAAGCSIHHCAAAQVHAQTCINLEPPTAQDGMQPVPGRQHTAQQCQQHTHTSSVQGSTGHIQGRRAYRAVVRRGMNKTSTQAAVPNLLLLPSFGMKAHGKWHLKHQAAGRVLPPLHSTLHCRPGPRLLWLVGPGLCSMPAGYATTRGNTTCARQQQEQQLQHFIIIPQPSE